MPFTPQIPSIIPTPIWTNSDWIDFGRKSTFSTRGRFLQEGKQIKIQCEVETIYLKPFSF